jgi:hypothetical protein
MIEHIDGIRHWNEDLYLEQLCDNLRMPEMPLSRLLEIILIAASGEKGTMDHTRTSTNDKKDKCIFHNFYGGYASHNGMSYDEVDDDLSWRQLMGWKLSRVKGLSRVNDNSPLLYDMDTMS